MNPTTDIHAAIAALELARDIARTSDRTTFESLEVEFNKIHFHLFQALTGLIGGK